MVVFTHASGHASPLMSGEKVGFGASLSPVVSAHKVSSQVASLDLPDLNFMPRDPLVIEVPASVFVPPGVSTILSSATGISSTSPLVQETFSSSFRCDPPSIAIDVVPPILGVTTTTTDAPPVPLVGLNDSSVFGCAPSAMPYARAMASRSIPKAPRKPLVKG